MWVMCRPYYDSTWHAKKDTHTHTKPTPTYNTVIFIHILMKHLLLQITYIHQEDIPQHPQVPSDQNSSKTTTALFISYFIYFKGFMYLYILMLYFIF